MTETLSIAAKMIKNVSVHYLKFFVPIKEKNYNPVQSCQLFSVFDFGYTF